jgi:enoyl-CoA hydratase
LPRLVGLSRAKELTLTGRQVRADEALRIGLADEVVPVDELMPRALGLAAECARGALTAQALAKRAIDRGIGKDLADGLQDELDAFEQVFATEDSRIGVESFLANGPGKAQFSGT